MALLAKFRIMSFPESYHREKILRFLIREKFSRKIHIDQEMLQKISQTTVLNPTRNPACACLGFTLRVPVLEKSCCVRKKF
jgi:hypothetical protein